MNTCNLGAMCEQAGVCYAAAHGAPTLCGDHTRRLEIAHVGMSVNTLYRRMQLRAPDGRFAVADLDTPSVGVVDTNPANDGVVVALFGPVDGDESTLRDARLFMHAVEAIDILKSLLQEYQHIRPDGASDPVARGRALLAKVEG